MGILKTLTLAALVSTNFAFAAKDVTKIVDDFKPIHKKIKKNKKAKLLYFWASWCPDCRSKLKAPIPEISKKFSDLDVVTVNLDRKSERGLHYVKESGLDLPVIRDEDKKLRKTLGIYSVPAWAVIERNQQGYWTVVASEAGSELDKINSAIKEAIQ